MKRDVRLEEISDGRLYHANDIVKIGCNDCSGCHECCKEMEALVLDPYDIHLMKSGLSYDFETLLNNGVCIKPVDGLLLPVMDTSSHDHHCAFLQDNGRCGIHTFRPGICRLFPLGRYYHDDTFSYILQTGQCAKKATTKIKIKKWLGYPAIKEYEAYVLAWHTFLTKIQEQLPSLPEAQHRVLHLYLLKNFYQHSYDEAFFDSFAAQLKNAYEMLGIS